MDLLTKLKAIQEVKLGERGLKKAKAHLQLHLLRLQGSAEDQG